MSTSATHGGHNKQLIQKYLQYLNKNIQNSTQNEHSRTYLNLLTLLNSSTWKQYDIMQR